MKIITRPAIHTEIDRLSEIMFAAKFHWDYPEEYKTLWREELTITPEVFEAHDNFVAEVNAEIVGFYSTIENAEDYYVGELFHPQGLWLENMFIDPRWIGRGIGKQLMLHLLERCRAAGIPKFCFYADPNAVSFYEYFAGQLIGHYPSSIRGRHLPLYELKVKKSLEN